MASEGEVAVQALLLLLLCSLAGAEAAPPLRALAHFFLWFPSGTLTFLSVTLALFTISTWPFACPPGNLRPPTSLQHATHGQQDTQPPNSAPPATRTP